MFFLLLLVLVVLLVWSWANHWTYRSSIAHWRFWAAGSGLMLASIATSVLLVSVWFHRYPGKLRYLLVTSILASALILAARGKARSFGLLSSILCLMLWYFIGVSSV
jgi:hypothetical protein